MHINRRRLLWRLLREVKPFWRLMCLGIFANIAYSGIDAGLTYCMRLFFDKGFVDLDQIFIQKIPLFIVLGITLRGLISAFGSYWMASVARSVVNVLRQKVFQHLVKLPSRYYDQSTSGQLLSKILYDVEQVAQVSADALTDCIQNTCLIVGLVAVMLVISWQLSLLFLITIPCMGILVNYTNQRLRRMSRRVQKTMGQVTEIASESIENYRVVRLFGGQGLEIQKFNHATEQSRRHDMKIAMIRAVNLGGVQTIIGLGIAMIIWVMVHLTSQVHVSPGSFLAVIAAMLQLIRPIKTLTNLNAMFQRGLMGAESVFGVLDEPIESSEGACLTLPIEGHVKFVNVCYGYTTERLLLKDLCFELPKGKVTALVGHSGGGKTTIAHLLPRFYELLSGEILLDGVSIRHYTLDSLRKVIALVSQHVTLFNDTIFNNIAYAHPKATREDVERAAALAFADEFIVKLPQQYDTYVGENGVLLSGGQRQRIAIARAILKDAPILILDEATSALDTQSEQWIKRALESVMQGRTTLVIAHRLSTIRQADQILVLDHGRIVEVGTHDTLVMTGGPYSKLYEAQHLQTETESLMPL